MPPEQAGGQIEKIDTRSDVFGLGAILCVILTGRAPYADKNIETVRLMAIGGQLADGLARLDACGAEPELIAVCKKCLSLEREDRPKDGGDVAVAIATFRARAEERARQAEIERAQVKVAEAEQRKRRKIQAALGLTFTLLVALGSSFAWRTKQDRLAREAEERERQTAVARDVNLAVETAVARYAQARGADNDLALWAEARAAALQAQERAASVGAPAEVQSRIKPLIDEIEQTGKNRRLVATLLEIQASMGDQLMPEGAQDFPGADSRYEQAFRDYGSDIFRISPEEGADLLRTLGGSRTMELAAALDDWAYVRSFAPDGTERLAHLLNVTRRLDPDPLRNRVRDAITAGDRQRLKAIGDDLDPAGQPIQTVNLIAVFINLFAGTSAHHPDTIEYLRRAQPHHSGDFQINHNLAWTYNRLGRHEEALIYGMAAIATRPRSAAAWQDRAIALRGLGRNADAADAFRRVIFLSPQCATACTSLGRALSQCGDGAGAIAAWRHATDVWKQAIKTQPGHAGYRQSLRATHVLLGNALRAEGDRDGAIAEFVQAFALAPLDRSTYAALSEAIALEGGGAPKGPSSAENPLQAPLPREVKGR
jgi:serine/threonine-protein kinase